MRGVRKGFFWLILVIFGLHISGCGAILYPERRHATLQADPAGRRIDPAVAILDAACLVFFIIPGVVAFAVDFATGAIYLPSGKTALGGETRIQASGEMDAGGLEKEIFARTGLVVDMEDPRMEAFVLDRSALF